MKKDLSKFMKTGSINDYLNYKKKQKESMEASKELTVKEKNEVKRGNSC